MMNQLSTRVRGKAARLGKMWRTTCYENSKKEVVMDIGSGGDTPEVHYRIQNLVQV